MSLPALSTLVALPWSEAIGLDVTNDNLLQLNLLADAVLELAYHREDLRACAA